MNVPAWTLLGCPDAPSARRGTPSLTCQSPLHCPELRKAAWPKFTVPREGSSAPDDESMAAWLFHPQQGSSEEPPLVQSSTKVSGGLC